MPADGIDAAGNNGEFRHIPMAARKGSSSESAGSGLSEHSAKAGRPIVLACCLLPIVLLVRRVLPDICPVTYLIRIFGIFGDGIVYLCIVDLGLTARALRTAARGWDGRHALLVHGNLLFLVGTTRSLPLEFPSHIAAPSDRDFLERKKRAGIGEQWGAALFQIPVAGPVR